mmetsp:Transcript_15112/g.20855  ORF Transcript_15112/g.20855 Transcript_15112/m.20855 type:complete len:242 (+) Transcript_15112:162-887(+)|eukprot:CAMPEP_0196592562 /NCGR_PEP_ID=MMETSP1081-20130531/73070_1 /TAXON_ID=36882 /ORGANISM="Pyramimonas amylifera, Strain CCMP720" /LENGTH=241 /DNA_ID=CAMNT_0041916289 /DNA_START=161 /DNA_END=886 /DNA_ORIENTATION=-
MLSAVYPLYLVGGAELAVLTMLLIPLSPINSLALAICGVGKSAYGIVVCGTVAMFLLAFMVVGLFDLNSVAVGEDYHHGGSRSADSQLMALIAGGNLVCFVCLGKLSGLMRCLAKMTLSHSALKKQAEGIQVEYKRLLGESSGDSMAGDKEVSELQRLRNEAAEAGRKAAKLEKDAVKLEAENSTLRAEAKAAQATSSALTKQAANVRREYDRLLEENDSIKDQLAYMDQSADNVANKKST